MADLPITCISKIAMVVLTTKIQIYIIKKNYSGHAEIFVTFCLKKVDFFKREGGSSPADSGNVG